MRKLFVICLLVPFVGFSQVKNVLNATRVFPRQDKITEFEKALANHSQKYHTGDWKWRVWSIESGPDAGGYMITEGPDSWSSAGQPGRFGCGTHRRLGKERSSAYTGPERHCYLYGISA